MIRRRLYYTIKPFLPWRIRMGLRRIAAARTLRRNSAVWPISPEAAKAPENWKGWPGAKQFSIVLTHDVEGPAGLAKVRALAQLEMDLGFRSSFNFIPEGPYSVPADLRDWLISNGFEVGVHDLNHDGKLYHSEAGFRKKAERINYHLKNWGATGFRSGFMLRNLDWIHRLDVQYDSSTFDTDPFEPQSTGANTIFPYWIRHQSGSGSKPPGFRSQSAGYVELPYTLPQDSTLFLVLQEKGPGIWLRKLDWIAEHGGMALLNVHPDYIQLDGEKASAATYPVAHYKAFLQHLLSRHSHSYWPALPREVATMTAQLLHPPELHRPKRVGMITHSFYETDNRVTRYAEALRDRGDHVEVLSLRRSEKSPAEESLRGVDVSRIQFRIKKSEQTKLAYFWPMLRFLLLSSWIITRRHAKRPYDILHVHNMPDFLVFSAWYPKLTGVRLILDIHDIVPELYASKFGAGKQPRLMPLLKGMERLSASFANHVIVSNHLWLTKYTARTGTSQRSSVFINNVDTRVYFPQRTRPAGEQIVLFPGGLQWHQGLDIALRAFSRVSNEIPNAVFHIYGDGNMKPSLVALTAELKLTEKVKFFEPVPISEIVKIMGNADLGVVPKRADSFGNQAYSTKIMEFMSLGVPVVVSSTEIDRYYFDNSVVRFFESGNSDALASAMIEVLRDASLRKRLVSSALEYAQRHGWNSRKADYLHIVDSLSRNPELS